MKKYSNFIDIPFHIFACCFPVKGKTRGILYDIQRQDFDYIPNDLIDIIEKYEGKTLRDIYNDFEKDIHHIIDEYFEFLFDNEYIFFSDVDKSLFPKLEDSFERPFKIGNMIIDVTNLMLDNINTIFNQIEEYGCEAILFIFNESALFEKNFIPLLEKFEYSSVRTLEIFVKNDIYYNFDYDRISLEYGKLSRIVFFSSDSNTLKTTKNHLLLINTKEPLDSRENIININNFLITDKLFFETKKFNNYFNRKVYIDENLNIRNSPNSEEIFGNIKNDNIIDIIEKQDFQKLWKISKDMIKDCMLCEYRYMCVDSNLLQFNEKEKIWERNQKCSYNPHNNIWS